MLVAVLYLLAAISAILGFLALIGAIHLALGFIGLFVAAVIFALVAYFLGGGRFNRAI